MESFDPTKTEAILLTKSTKMINQQYNHVIKFCGEDIAWKSSAKYLGVILDSKLTFGVNIKENLKKANKALATLYGLMKKNSGLPQFEKLTIYRAYIRPIMTYACPVFNNAAAIHMKKLQVMQNKCLRMALNAPYRTRITSLHKKAKIPTIKSFIDKLTKSFYEKSAKSNNKLISSLGHRHKLVPKSKIRHKMPRSHL